MTYHGVTVFAIPEFKSLEVLKKISFALILLSINPKNNPNTNPDLNYKEKNSKKKTLTQKYKIDVAGIRTPNCGMEDIYLDHYDTARTTINKPCLKTVFNIVALKREHNHGEMDQVLL